MTAEDAAPPGGRTAGVRWWLSTLVACAAVALPFAAVTVPPITDLPQQAAQMRLFWEALGQPDGVYRIQWLYPNTLSALPLALAWSLAPPLRAGGLAMALIGAGWVTALHATARAAGRSWTAAAIAGLFFWNHVTYWGFLPFLTGVPLFLWWTSALRRGGPRWLLSVLALALYLAHVFWLAAGGLWLLVDGLIAGPPWRSIARRSAALVPAVLAVAWWYPRFASTGFDSETFWGHVGWGRLSPAWWVPSVLGGLRGPTSHLLLTAVGAWLAVGLWQARGRWRASVDARFLVAAVLFATAALTLPGVARHTIFFASRWAPVAAVFTVLALPAPRLRPPLATLLVWGLVVTAGVATTAAWLAFEVEELDGFENAIASLPPSPHLLGLDFVRQSPRIRDYPTYHFFAYGQVVRGGTLNRSFADQASSFVVFRDLPKEYPWTRELDWRPERLRASDVEHFDHVLVHAPATVQASFLADPRLRPLGPPARWRLYRVAATTADPRGDLAPP